MPKDNREKSSVPDFYLSSESRLFEILLESGDKSSVPRLCPMSARRLRASLVSKIDIRKMDIISRLAEKNLFDIFDRIAENLEVRDLVNFGHVCKKWRNVLDTFELLDLAIENG